MRKAIRQTKGIIAHLISAYRGILRHAYLAGLIMTLWGGCLTAEAETYPWLKQASGTGYIQTDDQSLKGVTDIVLNPNTGENPPVSSDHRFYVYKQNDSGYENSPGSVRVSDGTSLTFEGNGRAGGISNAWDGKKHGDVRIAGNVEAWQKEKVTGNGLVQAYGAEISGSLINKSSPLYYNKVLWVFQLNNATVTETGLVEVADECLGVKADGAKIHGKVKTHAAVQAKWSYISGSVQTFAWGAGINVRDSEISGLVETTQLDSSIDARNSKISGTVRATGVKKMTATVPTSKRTVRKFRALSRRLTGGLRIPTFL